MGFKLRVRSLVWWGDSGEVDAVVYGVGFIGEAGREYYGNLVGELGLGRVFGRWLGGGEVFIILVWFDGRR